MRYRLLTGILGIAVGILLFGCTHSPTPQEEVIDQTTDAGQEPEPTNTPTSNPTATFTSTSIPTATPTSTNSPTPMSTSSPTPIQITVTVSTSSPSPTAIAEANVGPVIHYFRANVKEADPGDTIVLEWESSAGTTAVLYHVPPSLQLPQSGWQVAPSGSYTYKISPDERNVSMFSLYVQSEAGNGSGAHLSVKLRCPVPWFFLPAPDVCASDPILSNSAEQHFEHGTMIWIEEQDTIFVLDDGPGNKWRQFIDEWDEGEPDHDQALTPPDELYQPVRGFGLIWREQPGVRDRLGWAVDQETGFSTSVQWTTLFKYNSVYIRALDGNVWHLGPYGGNWEKIVVVQP